MLNTPISKKQNRYQRIQLILPILISLLQGISVKAEIPIVHALLFYSPTCPHCHKVISEDIPPLIKKYGQQLHIVVINVQQEDGNALYKAAIKQFQIPKERFGVPTLIVGNQVLVGSDEIPTQFPELIDKFLAQGGIDWLMKYQRSFQN
ncbi:Vitamin K epoxide reductase [Candidatus Thiomargarita nelsonii]|uniref:Vitamin K epoxide reductase n=1 Tax=Candidatus Thiomargarita nelsonii TaxID=1003181 RepID=A0A176RUN0_9GAMM|nr:Vitamin K epoxide reductase [Candidatus Thiomargarita nelsonii]